MTRADRFIASAFSALILSILPITIAVEKLA